MTGQQPLGIFVASAADLLTDHAAHGEGLIAWNLFSRLAERGHDVVVCAQSADLHRQPPFELIETGRQSRLESLEPLLRMRRARAVFEGLGGAARFAAVHWLFPQDHPAPVPPPTVSLVIGPSSAHWPEPSTRRPRFGDAVHRIVSPIESSLRARALAASASILISSPAARATLPPEVRQRALVVPFGIDVDLFDVTPLPSTPTVVFVGNLEEKKGIRDLIEAFEVVAHALPDAKLVIFGDGPERRHIEERSGDRIEYRGKIVHADVSRAFAGASIACLPSHGEPFGMAVLEAMAAGRAVVSTDQGGPPYLLDGERGGRLVPVRRPDLLAGAMIELLSSRESLRTLGLANRARAEQTFALDVVVDELEHHYRALSNDRHPRLAVAGVAP